MSKKQHDFDPALEARGKWAYILQDLAPELAEALGNPGHHVTCPVHGGKGDGFRLFKDFVETGGGTCNSCGFQSNGFALLAWIKGYHFRDAVREVAQWIRGENAAPTISKRPPPPVFQPVDYGAARERIQQVWTASKPIKGTPAETYLAARGIYPENMPPSLRFHPGLRYIHGKDKKDYGVFPCMLAPVKDKDGYILTIHRTFITDKGEKAPVPDAKKLMAKCADLNGSAIKLFPSRDVLSLAEGIETALAVRAISRTPVWSCVSAVLLEQVEIPESVRHVVIWADKDNTRRGDKAADVLAERLVTQGKTVEVCMPQAPIPEGQKGVDWLDVLLTQGIEGFPERWRNYRAP